MSVQDRCMVCARCTVGLQIVLDAPDGTPRSRGLCGTLLLSVSRQCWCRCKIGGRFALDVPKAYKSFWINSMVPLGDEALLEARFGPVGHSANLHARLVHGLRRAYHRLGNHF